MTVRLDDDLNGTAGDPRVLFVCRHGAAKSVLAAAEVDRFAKAYGIAIDVRAGGIEPDALVNPAVIAVLPEDVRRSIEKPRKVTADDIAGASWTITFDLEPSDLPIAPAVCERWDGLPSVSEDPRRYLTALAPLVEGLVDRVVNAAGRDAGVE